jgi:hypothetical protein
VLVIDAVRAVGAIAARQQAQLLVVPTRRASSPIRNWGGVITMILTIT